MSDQKPIGKKWIWISRGLVFVVLFQNLQASLLFWFYPSSYSPAFELHGPIGETFIKSLAVLFFMWNVPYVFAVIDPIRFKIALLEAVLMQSIGVIGESIIYIQLPNSLFILKQSIRRFILFDAFGLILLVLALGIIQNQARRINRGNTNVEF